jgi:hypothetical protein
MPRVRVRRLAALAVTTLAPSFALAHNPQIQIVNENGKIVTRGLFADGPYQSHTAGQRAYAIPLVQRTLGDANDGWYAAPNHASYPFAGPGAALVDGHFAAGSNLKVEFVGGLKLWNGSAFVDPGAEQLAVSSSALFTPTTATTDAAPFPQIALSAVTAAHDEHKTLRWRLLGDGASPNTPSDDGVYLAGFRLTSDQPGVAPSDPYYFLLSKNAPAPDQAAALAFVNANLVPEPAAGLMVAIVCGHALAIRRRRH